MEPARVRITTCHDPGAAALVRSMLGAHGIEVVVVGENHASMLGGLAGPLISLDVWVAAEDAEEARALLAERPVMFEADRDEEEDEDEPGPHWGLESRRRVGAVLLLSFCITFGTGHLYARAYLRAIGLAALEIFGLGQLAANPPLGAALVGGAIVADAIGATLRVRRDIAAQQLPPARIARLGRGEHV